MSEIQIHPECDELLSKLESLKEQVVIKIEEREYLINHIYKYLKTEYITKVGVYEYEVFEIDCNISRIKRKISMIQAAINLQAPIDLKLVEQELDKEFKDYMRQLEELEKEKDIALFLKKCEMLTTEEVTKLKKLYKALAKELHPDLNPNLTKEKSNLWNRAVEAYEASNLGMLEILYDMILKEKAEEKNDNIVKDALNDKVLFYEKKLSSLINEIAKIKESFPFNQEANINDEQWVKERQEELKNSIIDKKTSLSELEEYLSMMLFNKSTYIS